MPVWKCSLWASGWMKSPTSARCRGWYHRVCKWTICASGCMKKHHQHKLQLVTTTTNWYQAFHEPFYLCLTNHSQAVWIASTTTLSQYLYVSILFTWRNIYECKAQVRNPSNEVVLWLTSPSLQSCIANLSAICRRHNSVKCKFQ